MYTRLWSYLRFFLSLLILLRHVTDKTAAARGLQERVIECILSTVTVLVCIFRNRRAGGRETVRNLCATRKSQRLLFRSPAQFVVQ